MPASRSWPRRRRDLQRSALPRVFASQTLTKPGWTGVAAVSADGKHLAAVAENYAILIQDSQNGAILATLKGHRGTIVQMVFSPDCARLVSVGRDRTGILWDVANGRLPRAIVKLSEDPEAWVTR